VLLKCEFIYLKILNIYLFIYLFNSIFFLFAIQEMSDDENEIDEESNEPDQNLTSRKLLNFVVVQLMLSKNVQNI